jgi:hypothetical protein
MGKIGSRNNPALIARSKTAVFKAQLVPFSTSNSKPSRQQCLGTIALNHQVNVTSLTTGQSTTRSSGGKDCVCASSGNPKTGRFFSADDNGPQGQPSLGLSHFPKRKEIDMVALRDSMS